MKLLIDMNLSPAWVQVFERHGHSATHWSQVGDGHAPDWVLLEWAKDNGYLAADRPDPKRWSEDFRERLK